MRAVYVFAGGAIPLAVLFLRPLSLGLLERKLRKNTISSLCNYKKWRILECNCCRHCCCLVWTATGTASLKPSPNLLKVVTYFRREILSIFLIVLSLWNFPAIRHAEHFWHIVFATSCCVSAVFPLLSVDFDKNNALVCLGGVVVVTAAVLLRGINIVYLSKVHIVQVGVLTPLL